VLAIGLIGAPAGFAVASREIAGRAAGRMFAQEAVLGLAIGAILLMMFARQARAASASRGDALFSADLMLVLGALFCTVAGYYAVQPMMAAARAGQASVSFGSLHAISAGFYGLKALLVATLAWRQTGPNPPRSS
jgi:hypothetical protein